MNSIQKKELAGFERDIEEQIVEVKRFENLTTATISYSLGKAIGRLECLKDHQHLLPVRTSVDISVLVQLVKDAYYKAFSIKISDGDSGGAE